jgi:glycosyltransferase involved in cell wall biosynthesis
MPKPKLAIINSSSILKSYGGVAPFIKNLDPFLQEAFEVTYVLLPDYLYNIHFIPRRLIFSLYLIGNRGKWRAFDMILSHVPEGSFVVSFGKVPFIHIFHGNFNPMSQSRYWYGKYFKSVFEAMERRVIRKASLMYTVGAERPGIPKIFNPIHHDVKTKNPALRNGFIFSGRLEKIKNIDRIIRVYSKLSKDIQESNPLFIAGMGTQEMVLKNLAASLPIQGEIIFTGNLRNDDLIEAVSSKKILVMASSQEGFPMAIAEALSVGVPVISTETGDIARILKNNENGFLLPIDFEEEVYIQRIESVLNDYERFSANALASSSVFQAERVARALIQDINQKIARH